MLKGAFVLLLLAAIALGVFYFSTRSFDPDKQGEEVQAAVAAAMTKGKTTWLQVIDIAGEPQEYQFYMLVKQGDIEMIKLGAATPFDQALLAADIKNNAVPHGFRLTYRYSARTIFSVDFDNVGTAEVLERDESLKRLFDG